MSALWASRGSCFNGCFTNDLGGVVLIENFWREASERFEWGQSYCYTVGTLQEKAHYIELVELSAQVHFLRNFAMKYRNE
jgi:hypothetical protein